MARWTLQELLAPTKLYFFDKGWAYIGDKSALAERISRRTKIDIDALLLGSWSHISVSERMSWAGDRDTTRKEDVAYCLLGIFDVNMPLLYGEGDRAFIRLQEEIIRETGDQSILAWDATKKDEDDITVIGALATHPSQFRGDIPVEPIPSDDGPMTLTQKGIQIHVPIVWAKGVTSAGPADTMLALLSCRYADDLSCRIGIPIGFNPNFPMPDLVDSVFLNSQYVRRRGSPVHVSLKEWVPAETPKVVVLAKRDERAAKLDLRTWRCWLRFFRVGITFQPVLAIPYQNWYIPPVGAMTMTLPRDTINGAITTAVAFKKDESPQTSYCIVLRIEPSKSSAKLGVRIFQGPTDIESIRPQLKKLLNDSFSVADSYHAEVPLDSGHTLHATIALRYPDMRTFQVDLSSVTIGASTAHQLPIPNESEVIAREESSISSIYAAPATHHYSEPPQRADYMARLRELAQEEQRLHFREKENFPAIYMTLPEYSRTLDELHHIAMRVGKTGRKISEWYSLTKDDDRAKAFFRVVRVNSSRVT